MAIATPSPEAGAVPEPGTVARFAPSADPDAPETREFVACHRIALAEIPAHRVHALLTLAGGTPTAALAMGRAGWQSVSVALTDKQVARLGEALSAPLDPKLMERAAATGTYALLYTDPLFPRNLTPLGDAPPLLFVRGELVEDDRFSIAIVGTRRSSSYGDDQAARFAAVFAAHGLTIISGGAAGIDTAAHTGAMNAGGRTVAVLGCGVDIVYPAANRDLFARILRENLGAVVSEFALGTKPEPWRFPTRNRIIAGMARASLLIETPTDSGALGTAKCSVEYGRDVYVVPGPVDTGRSRGGHRLIGDGAILADSPEEVLLSLGVVLVAQEEPAPKLARTRTRIAAESEKAPGDARTLFPSPAVSAPAPPLAPPPPMPELPPGEAAFYAALEATPQPFDAAAQAAGLTASEANVAATLLEMKNLIRRYPGNLFSRM